MREESHLDDMRAAIRGDFERLAERRGAQELMNVPDEPAPEKPAAETEVVADATPEPPNVVPSGEPVLQPEQGPEPDPEPVPEPARDPEPVAEVEPAREPEPAPEPDPAPAPPERARSWLDRLLGR